MPTEATYSYAYAFGGSEPVSGFTTFGPPLDGMPPRTLRDGPDGAADGVTMVGQPIDTGESGILGLWGITSTGDPITYDFIDGVGFIYVVWSNDPGLFGTTITFTKSGTYSYCFAPGTRIATPTGDTAVEDLAPGDAVLTADGRSVPVRWIGQQTLHPRLAPARRCLVRIRAGALPGGLPRHDLLVTGDHALVLEDLLINASALVNGTSIAWEPASDLPDRLTVHHVETEAHEVLLAEGAAVESFIDYARRDGLDNHAAYLARYGIEPIIPEMPLPRVSAARLVPPDLRRRLGWNADDGDRPDTAAA